MQFVSASGWIWADDVRSKEFSRDMLVKESTYFRRRF
jgi:hypothetical protein